MCVGGTKPEAAKQLSEFRPRFRFNLQIDQIYIEEGVEVPFYEIYSTNGERQKSFTKADEVLQYLYGEQPATDAPEDESQLRLQRSDDGRDTLAHASTVHGHGRGRRAAEF